MRGMSKMDLLSSKASIEAYKRFVRLLEHDDLLRAILDDNNIAAEEVLYLPTDECGTFKSIGLRNILAKHLFSNENYKLFDIEFDVNEYTVRDDCNRITDIRLHVDCYLHFDVMVKALPSIVIDNKVVFHNGFGFLGAVNGKAELTNRVSKHAEFTVGSLNELISYMFGIMHRLLDENVQ